jgi:acetoacetyl-CoA reductase
MGIATFPEVHHAASLPLAEKVVLVTGGSRGIGRAIALELCERGATVALNYHHSRALAENVCEELIHSGARCEVFQGDVSDRIQARKVVQEVVDHFHHLDVLVNNAGITRDHSFRKMTDEEWLEVIETNLNSVFYCSSAALPGMMERNYGRIVNIASFVGQAGNFGQANYAASKGAGPGGCEIQHHRQRHSSRLHRH